jgi:hypothetical protein
MKSNNNIFFKLSKNIVKKSTWMEENKTWAKYNNLYLWKSVYDYNKIIFYPRGTIGVEFSKSRVGWGPNQNLPSSFRAPKICP